MWNPRRERAGRLGAGHTFFWIDIAVWGWMILGLATVMAWQAWSESAR